MNEASTVQGRELHRDFVGMLFALAIAEVAVDAAGVVNSGVPFRQALPAYSHLFLASMVIASSWVGWGWSKHSLSNVRHVFTKDFVELLLDVWLVTVYFFIVKGVELPMSMGSSGTQALVPSSANEVFWIMVVFITYFIWDLHTKVGLPREDGRSVWVQRGWATTACASMAVIFYLLVPDSHDATHVVVADAALLSLVFLFRAMKIADLAKLSRRNWGLIGGLTVAWLICLIKAR